MKKILSLVGLVATLFLLSENSYAQYLPTSLHRDGSALVGQDGHKLSSREVLLAVGEDIYRETYVGAVKQYNAGRKLILGGAIGLGVGLVGVIGTTAALGSMSYTEYTDGSIVYDDPDAARVAALGFFASAILASAGRIALDAGIPLKIIGKKRLEWIADDYNARHEGVTLHVGAAPHGVGLVMNF